MRLKSPQVEPQLLMLRSPPAEGDTLHTHWSLPLKLLMFHPQLFHTQLTQPHLERSTPQPSRLQAGMRILPQTLRPFLLHLHQDSICTTLHTLMDMSHQMEELNILLNTTHGTQNQMENGTLIALMRLLPQKVEFQRLAQTLMKPQMEDTNHMFLQQLQEELQSQRPTQLKRLLMEEARPTKLLPPQAEELQRPPTQLPELQEEQLRHTKPPPILTAEFLTTLTQSKELPTVELKPMLTPPLLAEDSQSLLTLLK